MPVIVIKTDGALKDIGKNLVESKTWTPKLVKANLRYLGPRVVERMREAVEENRYTGALSDSIDDDYKDGGMTVVIGPKAKRGKWDAGLILELGTKPIPNAPWMPIKTWADFRGIPAFPVWYKIRTAGVDAHPFLERTVNLINGEVQQSTKRLLDAMARAALWGE